MMSRAAHSSRSKGGRVQRNKGMPMGAKKLLVEQAKKQEDILSLCANVPLKHSIGDQNFFVEHSNCENTSENIKEFIFELTKTNIKALYDISRCKYVSFANPNDFSNIVYFSDALYNGRYIESGWGWSDDGKFEELTNSHSQYLIVRNSDTNEIAAFAHFRFDMDYGSHVLYCYELQVSSSVQSGGLGSWLMKLLHAIATSCRMSKVVLTVGRKNPRALKFYLDLGYRVDETSPSTLKDPGSGSYIILSLSCKSDNKENDSSHKNKPPIKRGDFKN